MAAGVKVSVVIVNHNSGGFILECLTSLFNQTSRPGEVIIIDNASTDGSPESAGRRFGREILLVRAERNRGFPAGLNAGAALSRGRYILSLNPDTVADPRFVESLYSAMESQTEDVGIGIPLILHAGGKGVVENGGHLLGIDGMNAPMGRGEKVEHFSPGRAPALPSGAAFIMKREVYQAIFPLDHSLFLYGDDAELGLKSRVMGWKPIFVPQARVFHHLRSGEVLPSEEKVFLMERNRIRLLLRYFPSEYILLSPLASSLRYLFSFLAFLKIERGERGATFPLSSLSGVIRAHLSALLLFPAELMERRRLRAVAGGVEDRVREILRESGAGMKEIPSLQFGLLPKSRGQG